MVPHCGVIQGTCHYAFGSYKLLVQELVSAEGTMSRCKEHDSSYKFI